MSKPSGIPLGQWSGADATDSLRETIREFNETTSEQTETMIRLTRWIVALTAVLVIGLGIQIAVAMH